MLSFRSILALIVLLSLLFTATAQASAIRRTSGTVPVPRNTLVPRQLVTTSAATDNTCQDSGSTACNISGASYCCPAQTECIPLENNTAVICCNVNEVCDEIHPIACPAKQDETKIQPQCGDECCPFGFECDPSGKKCLMKESNLPEKYKEKNKPVPTTAPVVDDGKKDDDDTATKPTPSTTPLLGSESGNADPSSCEEFPAKAVVVGFFPGMVAGVALLLLWTKLVEMRTRRRSIKSFGAFTNFPSEANLAEKNPGSVTKKPSFPIGFVVSPPRPQQQQQQQESEASASKNKMTCSPMSETFRSPNLGPIILPLSPPGATTPNIEHFTRLAPRPASRRRDSDAVSLAYSDSAVVDFAPPAPLNPRRKRHSAETGYSASVYNDGNESRPFHLDTRNEVAIPPIPKPAPLFYRQFGGPMPRPPVQGWTGARV